MGNACLAILEQMAGQHGHHLLSAPDQATRDQLFRPRQRGGGGRFAANTCAVDDRLGGQDLLVSYLLDQAIALLDHPARPRVAHGIANFNRRGHGLRVDPLAPRESLPEAAIERVGSSGLDRGDAREMSDYAQLICLAESLADGRGVA